MKSLEAKGIVISEKGVDKKGDNVTTLYSLRFKEGAEGVVGKSYQGSMKNPLPVVGKSYQGSMTNPLPVVGKPYPQETVLQKTVRQDNSNIRKASKDKKISRKRPQAIEPDKSSANPLLDDSDNVTALSKSVSTSMSMEKENRQIARGESDTLGGSSGDLESVGETLKRRTIRPSVQEYDEDRQAILVFIEDFARLLNDQAPLKSSVTRAYNIFKKSGLSRDSFLQQMYQARSITQERSASIKTTAGSTEGLGPRKNKMAYFFSVLAHLVGVQEAQRHYEAGEGSRVDNR